MSGRCPFILNTVVFTIALPLVTSHLYSIKVPHKMSNAKGSHSRILFGSKNAFLNASKNLTTVSMR
jgi:hypothetical protein